jgi:AAA-like domain
MTWEKFVTAWANKKHIIDSLILSEPLDDLELKVILKTYPKPLSDKLGQYVYKGLFGNEDGLRKCNSKIYEKCGLSGAGSKRKLRDELSDEFERLSASPKNAVTSLSNSLDIDNIIATEGLELELPEGVIPLNYRFYMEPIAALKQCYEAIIRPNALLRIQAPRQMGKTSLLERIINYANGLNYRVARIDLRDADLATLEDLELLLQWFCQEVCDRLDLPIVVAENWQNNGGSKSACLKFFEKYLLHATSQPLLLSLDNLDRIYVAPLVGEDFASLLRAWHDKNNNIWGQLKIIILYVWYVEPRIMNHSPFNVGCPIDLPGLTIDQIKELINLYGLDWGEVEIQQLTDLVGFHPFLIRFSLYHVATKKTSLAEILDRGYLADGLFKDHLMGHLRYLERQPEELRQIMAEVVNSQIPPTIGSSLLQRLNDAGLVKLNGDRVLPANKLYQLYFSTRLQANII